MLTSTSLLNIPAHVYYLHNAQIYINQQAVGGLGEEMGEQSSELPMHKGRLQPWIMYMEPDQPLSASKQHPSASQDQLAIVAGLCMKAL